MLSLLFHDRAHMVGQVTSLSYQNINFWRRYSAPGRVSVRYRPERFYYSGNEVIRRLDGDSNQYRER
jgi:hypothetical protein